MSKPSPNVTDLIKEHAALEREASAPPLGEHGTRSKEIRQEIVERYRPARDE